MAPATVVMADDGVAFDGKSLERGPLGGAETAFIGLAEGLAARGHRVMALTRSKNSAHLRGVDWAPLSELPEEADLYIANRGHRLIAKVPKAKRVAFWIHNPAQYLLKLRYLWPLFRRKPVIVTLGPFHASTLPAWVPDGGRRIIPYGLVEPFRTQRPRTPPLPKAIFTSNPLRRLDWLLSVWAEEIRPRVPDATLELYSSLTTYSADPEKYPEAGRVLDAARGMESAGVVLRAPVTKAELAQALARTRILLYGGDPGETFCLAVAEAQASGVPCVVARSTCLAERVQDGVTGFVLDDDDRQGFAERAVALLTDDALWRRQHEAALATKRGLSWEEVAALWEELLP